MTDADERRLRRDDEVVRRVDRRMFRDECLRIVAYVVVAALAVTSAALCGGWS